MRQIEGIHLKYSDVNTLFFLACMCLWTVMSPDSVLFSVLQHCKWLLGMCFPDVLLVSGSCFNVGVHACMYAYSLLVR